MRTIFRGDTVKFDQSFVDGATPLVPKTNYPKYTIFDPSNNAVITGVATSLGSGIFRVEYFVPLDAEISIDKQPDWRIEWSFVDISSRQFNNTETFKVLDEVALEETGREQKFITLGNQAYLAKIVVPIELYDLKASVLNRNDEFDILVQDIPLFDMTHRVNGNFHSYEFTTPALPSGEEYVVVWTIIDSSTSTPRFAFQVVSSLGISVLAMIPEVRMLIDKFQKGVGTIQGYEDSDIYEYIKQGASVINSYHPFTCWSTTTANSPMFFMGHLWIMAAAWYGLTAQHICEGDMQFSFGGLTTTLDVDRTGMIESALGRMADHLKDQIPAVKQKLYRKINGVGMTGVRHFGGRLSGQNYIYRVSNSLANGSNVLQHMQKIGLLTF